MVHVLTFFSFVISAGVRYGGDVVHSGLIPLVVAQALCM